MDFENRIPDIDRLQQEINAYRPLSDRVLAQLKAYYRIGLSYTSNALEGNSLTESETKLVIEEGLTVGGKPLKDHFEALGHSQAYDLLLSLAHGSAISEDAACELHRLFYYRIDAAQAGVYRTVPVILTGSDVKLPAPSQVSTRMRAWAEALSAQKTQWHPVEFAARLHADFVSIHPFIDGNGRTARLLMNLALLQAGLVIAIIPPVVRNGYLHALRAYDRGDIVPFVNFVSQMVLESQKDYLRLLKQLHEF